MRSILIAYGRYLPDLSTWIEATQSDSWGSLSKAHGASAAERRAERVRKNLNKRDTMDVLRRGVEMLGLPEPLSLVQFKPVLAVIFQWIAP
ncbi:hypothetical protein [Oleiagrimonas sp. C23AA]|uniref:hypothetical protein n=1 Tax=Oleiagrimonas sp. C23AA TaxID=2719047 RepID=UPI0014239F42|nr:hypothetical protein [Oleiagrimonas sp. C23AA]